MRIGGGRREETGGEAPPPKGPWSDLPPDPPPPRAPARFPFARRPATAKSPRRGRGREPLVNNWRGLLIILFLLFVAPWVARWASAVILGLMATH